MTCNIPAKQEYCLRKPFREANFYTVCSITNERKESAVSENKKTDISVCGTDCSACYCYGKMCNGCNACAGKVFHAPEGKACAIYECTVNRMGYKNCGACSKAPCEIWMKTRDPKYSDEEFNENVRMRMAALKKADN